MSIQAKGRLAGFVYLLLVVTGIFNLIYVPSQLINWQDAAQTVTNITSHEWLFRAGILVGVVSYVFYLILPFILYDIFKTVHRTSALFMVVFAAASVPVSLFNMVDKVNVLELLSGAHYMQAFSAEQIQAQVMLLLSSYQNGIGVVQIFWGLWLFPLGYLIVKSAYIPKILGVLLMLGCIGYLVFFCQNILFPDIALPRFLKWPGSFGEIGTCIWLLVMGVKDQTTTQKSTSA